MLKNVAATPPRAVTDRATTPEATVHGRTLTPGVEITVEGIRGRCAFLAYTRHESGAEWLDIRTSRGFARCVRPEAVKTVHRRRTGTAR